ncbi:MAG TPA: hypothetical protein VFN48_05110 [Solirubrobacteraceae bacterium]|nr:hypothetical protein [Solirubrobacteraceae bacterium]
MTLLLGVALGAPSSARADGASPFAVSQVARVLQAPPGVSVKILDGDAQMWLQAPPAETVIVLDPLGLPWLRFDARGVAENENSLLALESASPVQPISPARINARPLPHWVPVSSGHAFAWPDGRLSAISAQSAAAGGGGGGGGGRWRIPLTINGRAASISGDVVSPAAPSPVWFWGIAIILLCVLAGWRVRSPGLDRRLVELLTPSLLLALGIVGAARLLDGQPTVAVLQIIALAVVAMLLVGATGLFLRRRLPAALPFIVAFVALWAGLTFLPVLLHPVPLLLLPGWLDRAATVVLLGGGAGLVLVAMRRPLLRTEPHPQVAEAPDITGLPSTG